MDPKDIRNLQEAYIGVYDDDIREKLEFESWVNNLLEEGYDLSDYTWDELYVSYFNEAQYTPPQQIQQPAAEVRKAPKKNTQNPAVPVLTGLALAKLGNEIGKTSLRRKKKPEEEPDVKGVFEKLDIFGIVLEYLITEGYADTQEAAERIMVNMSEEWRESIVEEVLDEAYVDYKKGKLPSGRTPQQAAQGRSELLNAREKMDKSILGKPGAFERQSNQNRRTKEMDTLTASNPVNRAMRRRLGGMLPGGQPSTDRHSNAMDRRNRVADLASAEKKSRSRYQHEVDPNY